MALYIGQTINISIRVRRIAGSSGYTASSIPDIDICQAHTCWHICQHFNP
nr:MAG TPA: GIY-YIG nuclease superfamily protein [Caudoviricetes sp.]